MEAAKAVCEIGLADVSVIVGSSSYVWSEAAILAYIYPRSREGSVQLCPHYQGKWLTSLAPPCAQADLDTIQVFI